MCFAETERFITSLKKLNIPYGGIVINRIINDLSIDADRYAEQQKFISKFLEISENKPVFTVPQQQFAPLGGSALDNIAAQIQNINHVELTSPPLIQWPTKIPPSFTDFVAEGCQLIIVGGKGGVGKTTVSAAMAWAFANRYPDQKIRAISIDPA
ncbi:MAG: ArsA-related P-loop ATPase, partial [Dolichospermum sp.]